MIRISLKAKFADKYVWSGRINGEHITFIRLTERAIHSVETGCTFTRHPERNKYVGKYNNRLMTVKLTPTGGYLTY